MSIDFLTGTQREKRVTRLLQESAAIFDRAISEHVTQDGKDCAAVCLLFSGGK